MQYFFPFLNVDDFFSDAAQTSQPEPVPSAEGMEQTDFEDDILPQHSTESSSGLEIKPHIIPPSVRIALDNSEELRPAISSALMDFLYEHITKYS